MGKGERGRSFFPFSFHRRTCNKWFDFVGVGLLRLYFITDWGGECTLVGVFCY